MSGERLQQLLARPAEAADTLLVAVGTACMELARVGAAALATAASAPLDDFRQLPAGTPAAIAPYVASALARRSPEAFGQLPPSGGSPTSRVGG